MHAPKAIKQPEADFPKEARERGINGKCAVGLIVDTDGMPRDIHVVRCSDMVFAPNSMQSVSRYRFKPATTADGAPVAVRISVIVRFMQNGDRWPPDPIRVALGSPPGDVSTLPDSSGVYSLTKAVSPPALVKFFDLGYSDLSFGVEGKSACDVVLTVSAKGKPSDAKIIKCERVNLEGPILQSLMDSKYTPGSINGKPVAVRALMHVEYGEFPGQK